MGVAELEVPHMLTHTLWGWLCLTCSLTHCGGGCASHAHSHTVLLQTEQTLSQRMQEELNIVLSVSVYDVARNEDARKHRQQLVR